MNYNKVTSVITNTIAPTAPPTESTSPLSVCAADAPAPLLACVNDGGGCGGGGDDDCNHYGDVDNDDVCVDDDDDNYFDEGDTDEC